LIKINLAMSIFIMYYKMLTARVRKSNGSWCPLLISILYCCMVLDCFFLSWKFNCVIRRVSSALVFCLSLHFCVTSITVTLLDGTAPHCPGCVCSSVRRSSVATTSCRPVWRRRWGRSRWTDAWSSSCSPIQPMTGDSGTCWSTSLVSSHCAGWV